VDTAKEKVIQSLNLLCTESTYVSVTQPMTSKLIGHPTATMQDKPTQEAHPARHVRGSEERRPTK
jgi:hypothetical protein